ncbi:MAG TPA: GIY-YIG nuclease family protein [Bdellovibrionota bacterium]|nr:GIY-YIG nuclease family protein [Bdellovibrionota bacterium]
MQPAIYILSNRHRNVLYTGVTSNLARRMYEHKNKLISGFTFKYNVDQLVYYELFEMMTDAISREKMIKKKSREGKIKLIESINPDWNDLSTIL